MADQYLTRDIVFLKSGGYKRTVIFWEDDQVTRKDTTGWSVTMEITKGNEQLALLSENSGHVVHTPAQGQFNISLTDADILAYEFSAADYRLKVDTGDDYPQVFMIGTVRIK